MMDILRQYGGGNYCFHNSRNNNINIVIVYFAFIVTPSPAREDHYDGGAAWYHISSSFNHKRSHVDTDEDSDGDYSDYGDEDEDYGDEDDDDDPSQSKKQDISCIGVRKLCLIDRLCRDTLTDYRRLCQENKKRGVCVSPDR